MTDITVVGLGLMGAALAQAIQQQGQDSGIDTAIPDFVAGYFERAIDAGHGEKYVMSLIKLLQDR